MGSPEIPRGVLCKLPFRRGTMQSFIETLYDKWENMFQYFPLWAAFLRRSGAAFENIVDQINGVSHIYITITICVSRTERFRRRVALEDVIDDVDRIGDADGFIRIGVSA